MKKHYTKYAGIRDIDDNRRINWLKRQFNRYEDYWRPDIEMCIRNARMYWQINYGQWPMGVVEKLRAEGRRPPTFPMITDKLESLVGNFMQNSFDIRLEPRNNQISTLTYKAQDIITADKHNMEWDTAKIQCLLDSFIKMGAERMVVSDLKNPYGNIAFESLNPRHVYLNPGWKSNYVRDLMDYFVWDKMTYSEIKQTYKKSSDRLNQLYEREKREGIDYGIHYGAVPRWRSIQDKWDSRHLVIEHHHVQHKERMWEFDRKNNTWFPDNMFPQNSEGDRASKLLYAQQMGLTEDNIVLLKQKKRVKFIEAICPDIDNELFLDKGKDIIQTNNCNIYPLGIRYYGQYQGMVDRLYDIQIAINKGEMNIQDIQQRSAKGAFMLDRALTGGDPALEAAIEQGWNDPAARIWTDEYATERLPKGGIIELPGVHPTSDMFRQTDRYYEHADRFSKVPAAQDARTESSKESGKLFKFKFEAGIIQQKYLLRFYETHEKNKIEAAILQAKITYAGVPRTFTKPGSEEPVEINQEVTDLATGDKLIIDDISALPEMNVILIPSKTSVSVRDDIKQTSAELLQTEQDPLISLVLKENIAMSSELTADEAVKESLEKAFHLAKAEAAMMKMVNMKEMNIKLIRADLQLNALKEQSGVTAPEAAEDPIQQQMSLKAPQQVEEDAVEGTPVEPENQLETNPSLNVKEAV